MNDITTGNTFNALPFGVEELRAENERLRDALRKLQPHALKPHLSGQGQNGRWHESRICASCGALFKRDGDRWVGNHQKACDFAKVEGE